MSKLNLDLLGPARVIFQKSRELTFSNRKELALLAYLVVETDRPHSRELFMGLLWPELPTPAAQNNLRVTLSQLHKHLKSKPDDTELYLITSRLDLQFNLESDYNLDVSSFLNLIAACHKHDHPNLDNCFDCINQLTRASELVRGEFMAGFSTGDCPAFDEWLIIQRERLHLQITFTLTTLADFHEHSGNLDESIKFVQRLLEFDPLREPAHRQLMRLLASAGRRSAALEQYDTCRRLLATDLGLAPAPETVLLGEQIRGMALVKTETKNNNLPPTLTRFFGRTEEIEELQNLLTNKSGNIVTLAGTGGVGKTRLALQVAYNLLNHFKDGVWLVELEGLKDASAIITKTASVLGITTNTRHSLTFMIRNILQNKSIFIILDNCDHLRDACNQLINLLRQAAPQLTMLTTSRTPLHIAKEHVMRLQPFHTPNEDSAKFLTPPELLQFESIQFFVHRASQSLLNLRLNDANVRLVSQICKHLDGIPLAIEITAARAASMSIKAIAEHLDHRFRWLNTKGSITRQRTLYSMIEWSFDLLNEQERSLFCFLSVFSGGWMLEAAEAIFGDEDNCVEILSQLVDQSLVVFGDDQACKRYHMHETIRQFAAAKLTERGNEGKTEVLQRHSQYYLSMLESGKQSLKGKDASTYGTLLFQEVDNIRQAWLWAVDNANWVQLCRSAAGLSSFYSHIGMITEGVHLLQVGIDSPELDPSTDSDITPYLIANQIKLLNSITTLDELHPQIEHFLSLTHNRPEFAREQAEIYLILSMQLSDQDSNFQKARNVLEKAISIAASLDDPELEALLKCESGRNYLYNGEFEKAVAVLQQALMIFKKLDHIPGQALAYSRLAPAYAESYNLGPALVCDQEALRLFTLVNHRSDLSKAHNNLAETFVLLGAYQQAKEHAEKSLAASQDQCNKVHEANTLSVFAACLLGLGRIKESEEQYRKAIQSQEELCMNWSLRYSLLDWGDLLLNTGRPDEAEIYLDKALIINQDTNHLRMTTQSKLAMVYLAQGKTSEPLKIAGDIWVSIEPLEGRGLPFPIKTMFECFTVFKTLKDPRASDALNLANNVIDRTAAGIDNPEFRVSFLNNVPVNKKLREISEYFIDQH